jgi:diadenosine tetraphosphatase ApaH/serine/threonine PP2A family protein phosphatase
LKVGPYLPGRHIFIGDIHGCFDELGDLLTLASVSNDDVVVALGDLTRKGPAPDRCVELWIDRRYLVVLGNNDAKMLARAGRWTSRVFASAPDRKILRRPDLLRAISRWPLYLDFPEIGAVAVHGGVLPNSDRFSPDLVPREAALELRYVRRNGQWRMVPRGKEQKGDRFWAEVWDGDRTVLYGHTPQREPKIDRRAIGIDTGCVYGGKLTAVIFERAGQWKLMDVPARRAYAR